MIEGLSDSSRSNGATRGGNHGCVRCSDSGSVFDGWLVLGGDWRRTKSPFLFKGPTYKRRPPAIVHSLSPRLLPDRGHPLIGTSETAKGSLIVRRRDITTVSAFRKLNTPPCLSNPELSNSPSPRPKRNTVMQHP